MATTRKRSKEAVNYRKAATPARECQRCRHFFTRNGRGMCHIVAGQIGRTMTCDRFQPKRG